MNSVNSEVYGSASGRAMPSRMPFRAGPLAIDLYCDQDYLRAKAASILDLYTVDWGLPARHLTLTLREGKPHSGMVHGSFLSAQRMQVEQAADGLRATCLAGAYAACDPDRVHWHMVSPEGEFEIWRETDIEHLFSLLLTTGWRDLGWVPLHAGTAVKGNICALFCATSGGGKTTLTAAMVHRGWQTLGDDKLLLGLADGAPSLRGLVHHFNLYPAARRWFPEIGDLTALPRYSAWTDKRRVPIASVWPQAPRAVATPTHLVAVERRDDLEGVTVRPLAANELLQRLLQCTVVPTDKIVAAQILKRVVQTARGMTGIQIAIGPDAYADPAALDPLEEALES